MAESKAKSAASVEAPVQAETPVVAAAPVAGVVAPKKSNAPLIIVIVVVVMMLGLCGLCVAVPSIAASVGLGFLANNADKLNDVVQTWDQIPSGNTDNGESTTNGSTSGSTSSKDINAEIADCEAGCKFLTSDQKGLDSCMSLCEDGIYTDRGECEKVSAGLMRSSCWASIAKDKKDVSYCDKMDKDLIQDGCYSDVAEALHNKAICDKVNNEFMKPSCIENATK